MDSNAFNDPGSMAPQGPKGRARPKAAPPQPAHPASKPRGPAPSSNTAASGVPRSVGKGPRQLDGTQGNVHSAPVKRGGLAERLSSPNQRAGSSDRVSGLEAAMHASADQHHPRKRPKVTQR